MKVLDVLDYHKMIYP